MNTLEKILKEIEEAASVYSEFVNSDFLCGYYSCINEVKKIIHYHTDEADFKTDNDLISRKILKEEVESLRMIITGMRNGKIMTNKALEEYKKSILKIIDEQPCCSKDTNVATNDGGILRTCDTCRRNGKSDHNCYYCCRKPRRNLWEPKEAGNE